MRIYEDERSLNHPSKFLEVSTTLNGRFMFKTQSLSRNSERSIVKVNREDGNRFDRALSCNSERESNNVSIISSFALCIRLCNNRLQMYDESVSRLVCVWKSARYSNRPQSRNKRLDLQDFARCERSGSRVIKFSLYKI